MIANVCFMPAVLYPRQLAMEHQNGALYVKAYGIPARDNFFFNASYNALWRDLFIQAFLQRGLLKVCFAGLFFLFGQKTLGDAVLAFLAGVMFVMFLQIFCLVQWT